MTKAITAALATVLACLALASTASASAVCGQWYLDPGKTLSVDYSIAMSDLHVTTLRGRTVYRRSFAYGSSAWSARYGSGDPFDVAATSGTGLPGSGVGPYFQARNDGTRTVFLRYPCS